MLWNGTELIMKCNVEISVNEYTMHLIGVTIKVSIIETAVYFIGLPHMPSCLFALFLPYLLTPWSRVLLEKLTSKLCS